MYTIETNPSISKARILISNKENKFLLVYLLRTLKKFKSYTQLCVLFKIKRWETIQTMMIKHTQRTFKSLKKAVWYRDTESVSLFLAWSAWTPFAPAFWPLLVMAASAASGAAIHRHPRCVRPLTNLVGHALPLTLNRWGHDEMAGNGGMVLSGGQSRVY